MIILILSTFGLSPSWADTSAQVLEKAWAAKDSKATKACYAPGIWETQEDGGSGLFEQILRKQLQFRLVREHQNENRAVAVYDVWRQGRRVDRVFTFFVDGKVWAHTENKSHSVYFYDGKVPARLDLSKLPGTPDLASYGRAYLNGESTRNAKVDEVLKESTLEFSGSHVLESLGRALIIYGNQEYGLILERDGMGWHVIDDTYSPSATDLLPRVGSHPILAN